MKDHHINFIKAFFMYLATTDGHRTWVNIDLSFGHYSLEGEDIRRINSSLVSVYDPGIDFVFDIKDVVYEAIKNRRWVSLRITND